MPLSLFSHEFTTQNHKIHTLESRGREIYFLSRRVRAQIIAYYHLIEFSVVIAAVARRESCSKGAGDGGKERWDKGRKKYLFMSGLRSYSVENRRRHPSLCVIFYANKITSSNNLSIRTHSLHCACVYVPIYSSLALDGIPDDSGFIFVLISLSLERGCRLPMKQ
jgi:hypothetical protein